MTSPLYKYLIVDEIMIFFTFLSIQCEKYHDEAKPMQYSSNVLRKTICVFTHLNQLNILRYSYFLISLLTLN